MSLGDFTVGDTIDFHFTTRKFSTGAPFTLAGTPVISAYEDNGTTQITAGITITADFDSVTGLNHVRVVASGANGFETGKSYSLIITTGTVDSVSVVGEVIGYFTLGRSSALTRIINNVETELATINAKLDTIDNFIDTEIADIQTRLPAALIGGRIDSNVGAISADSTAADNLEAAYDGTGYAHNGNTYPWTAAWDAEVQSEVEDGLVAKNLDKLVTLSGTADSGSTTTMVDAARTEADADYWKGQLLVFTSGTISGQSAIVTDFNATTDTFTFAPPTTQAVSTNTYVILPLHSVWDDTLAEHLASGTTGNALNAAGAAGDPWSTALPGAYGAGTAGKIVGDNINATISSRATPAQVNTECDTAIADARLDELLAADSDIDGAAPPTVGSVFHELMTKTAGSFTYDQTTDSLEAVRDRGDAAWVTPTGFSTHSAADVWSVATRILTAGTNIALEKGTGVTGFNDLSAAQVNAEVVDALATDTYAEPGQGAPAATTSLSAKINYMYKAWRNKTEQTATQYSLYNDAGTVVDQKAAVSDDATTFTRAEIATGP